MTTLKSLPRRTASRAPGPGAFVLACWALRVVPVGIAVWFVQGFSLAMPLFDHWTLLPILTRLTSGKVLLSDLFLPHNGLHVAPFVKLILAALATITGWSFRAEIFVGFGLVIYTVFALDRALAEALPESKHRETRAIVSLLTTGLLFSPAQDWIWTWSIGFFHYFENASVATVVWALAKRKPNVGLAVLGCTLATFNRLEGMFTWVVFLPALFFALERVERKRAAWTAWGGAGALSSGVCLALILTAKPLELAGRGSWSALSAVARFHMAASLAGMSAGFFTEQRGIEAFSGAAFFPTGVAVLVLFFATGAALVKVKTTRSSATPFLCLGGFALAFVSATATARYQGTANAGAFPLMRCYLSSYAATASLLPVATVHSVALLFANRSQPMAHAVILRRVAAALGVSLLLMDYAHAAQRLEARRADGHWDHYCVELAAYFAKRSTCLMPAGGAAAIARSGLRKMVTGAVFEPNAPPMGRIDAAGTAIEPFGNSTVPALAGFVDLPDISDGTVFLAFGNDRRFVGQASQLVPADGGLRWVAMLPWTFVDADRRPLRAWAYDRKRRVFRRLSGEGRPRRGGAPVR